MRPCHARRIRLAKCLLIIDGGGLYGAAGCQTLGARWPASAHAQSLQARESGKTTERFDEIVRADFFAGMMGDEARLDRGMKFCEEILASNPKHADALVWHGGGLLTRASRAYAKGDSRLGDDLWNRGLEEMNDAVRFEPDNMGVKIGRSATLIGLAQSGWNASDAKARALLTSALEDYEKVYRWQKPSLRELGTHSRGELLFGLASGWSILGERGKALGYLRLVVSECKGTGYEREARRWLGVSPLPVVQHDCVGCHVSRP